MSASSPVCSTTTHASIHRLGMGSMMTLMNYGDRWRKQRRLMQTSFSQQESAAFRPDIQEEVNKFVLDACGFEGDIRGLVHQ